MKRLLCLISVLLCSAVFANPTVESEVKARGEDFAAAWKIIRVT